MMKSREKGKYDENASVEKVEKVRGVSTRFERENETK